MSPVISLAPVLFLRLMARMASWFTSVSEGRLPPTQAPDLVQKSKLLARVASVPS